MSVVMSDDKGPGLTALINASGFLFQLAVEHEIMKSAKTHQWEVLSREHPWREPETRQEGFIDLVVARGAYRQVVECKRPRDADWVFLAPHGANPDVQRVRGKWWFVGTPDTRAGSGWYDFDLKPSSYEAAFCVVRGKGESDRPMLERVADDLLTSLDCLAAEELSARSNWVQLGIYFPVVITTARLNVCKVDPSAVSLADGMLPDASFEEVPLVRFHKTLSTDLADDFTPADFSAPSDSRERTILVVNAAHLSKVLPTLEPRKVSPWDMYPWQQKKL